MSACLRCATPLASGAKFCPHCGTAVRAMSEPATWEGQLIDGRYAIRARIGAGGSGTVYLADHIHLGKRVALKALHKDLLGDDMALERFRREATMVGELTNPHIVQILDYGRLADGRVYLAMEYLEGESLEAMLARLGRVSIDQTLDVLLQACDALGEAHSVGYVHRDLRPKNLFLTVRATQTNFLKIVDFGLAKAVDANNTAPATSLGLTFGDPRYMSPEQAKGAAVDRRSDLYQMGCVAYEMLTGAPPFSGSGVFEVLAQHGAAPPPPLAPRRADVPAALERVVLRLLAKAPDERFATAMQVADALRAIQADDVPAHGVLAPSAAVPAVSPSPAPPASVKHTAPAGADAVLAVDVARAVVAAQAVPPTALGTSQAWFREGDLLELLAQQHRNLNDGDDDALDLAATSMSASMFAAASRRRGRALIGAAAVASAALAIGVVWLVVRADDPEPTKASMAPMPATALPPPPLVPQPASTLPPTTTQSSAAPPAPTPPLDKQPSRPSSATPSKPATPPVGTVSPATPSPSASPATNAQTALANAEAALASGDLAAAAQHIQIALAGMPNSSQAHTIDGEIYLAQGAFPTAADAFKVALQLNPDNGRARRGYLTADAHVAPPADDETEVEPIPTEPAPTEPAPTEPVPTEPVPPALE